MKSNHFKMRWLCLLFALFTLNIQAQITVDIKNKPLKEAIKTIERSSNYSFFYNVFCFPNSSKRLNGPVLFPVR